MINYFSIAVLFLLSSQSTIFGQEVVPSDIQKKTPTQLLVSTKFANNLDIYPNPASHKIRISNTSKDDVEVTIFNIVGHPLVTRHSGIKDVEISIENLSDGIYIVAFNNGREVVTQRLVKRS